MRLARSLLRIHHYTSTRRMMQASVAPVCMAKKIIRGVVFDMDGTVTVPVIDFLEMRRRCGVPAGQDILDAINSWPDAARRESAFAAIAEMEEAALLDMKVMPGCDELCGFLDARQVKRGLITRNVRRGVAHFHEHHLTPLQLQHFHPAVTRECDFAYKPSPEALLHICQTWGIPASECVMIVSGNRAGALTILLDYNGKDGHTAERLQGEQRPTHVVTSLLDIVQLLQEEYELQRTPTL